MSKPKPLPIAQFSAVCLSLALAGISLLWAGVATKSGQTCHEELRERKADLRLTAELLQRYVTMWETRTVWEVKIKDPNACHIGDAVLFDTHTHPLISNATCFVSP